ncbi:MAG TPA: tRNA pseudouridine(55) synthase TruB [Vicinamibacterales bacterium]|nr:tRNA pseudouridine(55) synthase TruB [Vicinamibacterales bacterium]
MNSPLRTPHSALDGVLVVDKTEGPTSHDVVTLARRALGLSRIGHTGTLDPMATGVLPLVIGRATRLAQFLTANDKTYEATIAFGRTTDTLDASGTIVTTSERRPTGDELAAAIQKFQGTFDQTPPVFSAKNIDGERSYDLARRGKLTGDMRPKAVSVTVNRLEVLAFDGESARLELEVTAGFYVRSLAHDLGAALDCGAILTALRRTQSGEFGLDRAVPLADVLQTPRESLSARMIPFRGLLPELPAVTLRSALQLERLKNGVEIGPADLLSPLPTLPPIVRLMGPDGDLVGLARPGKAPGCFHGWVVLA